MTVCCVRHCKEIGTHQFPKDVKIQKKWLRAIRRINLTVKSGTKICSKHFTENDFEKISKCSGVEYKHKILKKSAVPSLFPWNVKPVTEQALAREERLRAYNYKRSHINQNLTSTFNFISCQENSKQCADFSSSYDIKIVVEEVPVSPTIVTDTLEKKVTQGHGRSQGGAGAGACPTLARGPIQEKKILTNVPEVKCFGLPHPEANPGYTHAQGTQTLNINRLLSTELSSIDNELLKFYTGLETYTKFKLVLSTLLPMAHEVKYRWSRVIGLSIEDQFLMMLIKLRRNKTDFEVANMFSVSEAEVFNVIVTWINFVNDIWSLIYIWPSRELIDFYMPDTFRKNYPSTRVIIDVTEIPIQNRSHLDDTQKVSFSQYKHKSTLKVLVGASPGGLLTYCSDTYAGSVSDRQIVQHSNLFDLCEPEDNVMADRGLNFQALFATKGVGINIPTFMKGRSQVPGLLLTQNQKLLKQRVQIERVIELTKTYKILTNELNQYYLPLASKIFRICVMLCNFREGSVNKNS